MTGALIRNVAQSLLVVIALAVPLLADSALGEDQLAGESHEFGPCLELSGVVEKDGVLFMVDDKTNSLIAYDSKTRKLQDLGVKGIPTERTDRAKFEDIAFHKESDTLFVIGAHFKTEDKYKKTYQFKLRKEGDQWTTLGKAEELPIAADIIGAFESDRDGVEGIAATGENDKLVLWVGLRSHAQGFVRLLKFERDGGQYKLAKQLRIKLEPGSTADGRRLHLSGLSAIPGSESRLLLLTSSEEDNSFHGNRLFLIEPEKDGREIVWAGPEFDIGQKAEGITVWGDTHVGIVYDNDASKTHQPSRLLIFKSAFGLGR